MDQICWLFYGEAVLNLISGLAFLISPFWQLRALIFVKEQHLTDIEELLCYWWATMLWTQSGLLFLAARDASLRKATYQMLLIGEVVLIPILLHYIWIVKVWYPTLKFIFILFTFGIGRLVYLYQRFFLGDLIQLLKGGVSHIVITLDKEARDSKQQIAICRMGPVGCPYLAMVHGQESVKAIASGHIKDLRKTLDPVKIICGLENGRLSSQFVFQIENAVIGRNKLKRFLSGPHLDNLSTVARSEFSKLFESWKENKSVHLTLGQTVFKIFSRVVLGYERIPDFTFEQMEQIQLLTIKGSPPTRFGALTKAQREFVKGKELYWKLCSFILELNRESILKGNNYIWSLMEELEKEKSINDPEIIGNIGALYFGLGNPISLLEFSLYILRENPIIAERLRNDTDYLIPTFKELLRYICPANLIFRYLGEDYEFNSQVLGKGNYVGTCLRSICRDPQYWNNPEVFNPDRFIDNPISFQFPNVPFSLGERICPAVQATEYIFREFIDIWKGYRFISDQSFQMPAVDAITRLPDTYRGYFTAKS